MLSSAAAEFDIQSRVRWLAHALASTTNAPVDFEKIVAGFEKELSQTPPSADQLSWFALERLSNRTGLRALKLEYPGQSITGASLIWVSPAITPNEQDAASLGGAAIVVAAPEWGKLIQEAKAGRSRPRFP
jgi:hypothetical protein